MYLQRALLTMLLILSVLVAAPTDPRTLPATAACAKKAIAAADFSHPLVYVQATGTLAVSRNPAFVLMPGDIDQEDGALANYAVNITNTAWGSLRSRMKPAPGNHDYRTPNAAGYFTFFGNPAPYYAFTMGCGWRGYSLNSEIDLRAQVAWLTADLAANPIAKIAVYWHKPRFSSGTKHGDNLRYQRFLDALGTRPGVVLWGHDHLYERFAPLKNKAMFTVGTAGDSTTSVAAVRSSGSVVALSNVPGVLELVLTDTGYSFKFLDTRSVVRDSGTVTLPAP